jgi:hypothetical protein
MSEQSELSLGKVIGCPLNESDELIIVGIIAKNFGECNPKDCIDSAREILEFINKKD